MGGSHSMFDDLTTLSDHGLGELLELLGIAITTSDDPEFVRDLVSSYVSKSGIDGASIAKLYDLCLKAEQLGHVAPTIHYLLWLGPPTKEQAQTLLERCLSVDAPSVSVTNVIELLNVETGC